MKTEITTRDQAIADFHACRIQHRNLVKVMEAAERHLLRTPSTLVVNIVGPSGVGKSVVAQAMEARTIEASAADMVARRHIRPYIATTAMASGHHRFSWTGLCWSAREAMNDPFLQARAQELPDDVVTASLGPNNRKSTLDMARSRLQAELRLREVWVWCIDEIQHAVHLARRSEVAPEHQLNVFKSIVQLTSTKLLLVGTAEVARHFFGNGQLARRSQVIYFTRYREDDPEDFKEFLRVVRTFFSKMAIGGTPSLNEAATLLYAGSVGCIGVLKDWMERALVRCLDRCNDPREAVLTLEDFRLSRLRPEVIRQLMKELQDMELSMKADDSDKAFEEIVFGVEPKRPRPSTPRAPGRTKPGVRNPVRDALGADGIWGQPT